MKGSIPILLGCFLLTLSSRGLGDDQSRPWELADTSAVCAKAGAAMLGVNQPQQLPENSSTLQLRTISASGSDAVTPEIEDLARSLNHDAYQILRYCHDQIRYECYWGAKKGATGTLLEGSGNCFDISSLMVALLKVSNYQNIEYRYGLTKLDRGWVSDWLGLLSPDSNDGRPFADLTDQELRDKFQLPSSTVITDDFRYDMLRIYYIMSHGVPNVTHDGSDFIIPHVWVRFKDSAGDIYEEGPSFKFPDRYMEQLFRPASSDLSYSRTSFLTAVGGTLSAGGKKIANVGVTTPNGLNKQLSNITNNFLDWLKEYEALNVLGDSVLSTDDFIYRKVPQPMLLSSTLDSSAITAGIDYLNGTGAWLQPTSWSSIPAQWESKVTFSFGTGYNATTGEFAAELDSITLPTSSLGGDKLSLTYAEGSGGLLTASFRLNEEILSTFNVASGSTVQLKIAVTHPHGTYNSSNGFDYDHTADQEEVKTYKCKPTCAYAIVYGFDCSALQLRKSQRRLDEYKNSGLPDNDWRVRSETLNVIGLTYLQQVRSINDICASRKKVIYSANHVFGRFAQEDSYYIDVGLGSYSGMSYSGNSKDSTIAFGAGGNFNSAMEHGVIEQLQGSSASAVSTVKVLQLASAQGIAINLADNTNWSSLRPTLEDSSNLWDSSVLDQIEQEITGADAVNHQAQALVPQKGSIGLTATPADNTWRGYSYAVDSRVESAQYISGNYGSGQSSGGYGTQPGEVVVYPLKWKIDTTWYTMDDFLNSIGHDPDVRRNVAADPVDMATGAFTDKSTDLACGGDVPHGLTFYRSYNSGRSGEKSPGLGNGWTHNLDIRAARRSASRASLGETTPSQMAATYAAVTVALDLYENKTTAKDWLVAALTSCWAIDQIRDNGVTISIGERSLEFVRMPDGSYAAPGGCTMTLADIAGGGLTLSERHGNTHTFSAGGQIVKTQDNYGKAANFSYLSDGHLDWVSDCYGRKLTLTWDGDKIKKVKETAGSLSREVSFIYDGDDLKTVTDPEGKNFTYLSQNHRITSMIDGRGRVITENDYDDKGRVQIQRLQGDPAKTFQLFYSGSRNVERNPAGQETVYLYDRKGRPSGTIDAIGNQSRVYYDGDDHIVESASPKNNHDFLYFPRRAVYDGNQNLLAVDSPKRDDNDTLPTTTKNVYDSQLRLWKEYDFSGNYKEYLYNTHDQLLTVKDRKGVAVRTFTYNTDGTLRTTKDGANSVTTYSNYDSFGKPQTVTYSAVMVDGSSTTLSEQFVYNARGDQTSHTDARGNATLTTYNERRQPRVTTLPAVGGISSTLEIQYDDAGQACRKKDANGFWTATETSQTGKLLTAILPSTAAGKAILTNHYDARDWCDWSTNALGQKSFVEYDAAGRPKISTDPLGRTIETSYSPDGEIVAVKDPRQKTATLTYNRRGECFQSQDALGQISGSQNNANGLRGTSTNRRGNTFVFGYDENGNLTSQKSPLLKTSSSSWNSRGLVDYTIEPSGDRIDCTYDALKRCTQTVYKHGGSVVSTVGVSYDANANIKKITETVTGAVRTSNYTTYDSRDRLTSYTDANGSTIGYGYDANGNLTRISYPADAAHPSGKAVVYTYDALNRLETVTDWAARVTRYSYDLAGRVNRIQRPNGTSRRFAWNAAGELTGISEMTANGTPILWISGEYDQGGRLTKETAFPAIHSFSAPVFAATYDTDNQIATFNGASAVYDSDGNMTQGPLGGSLNAVFIYDSRNRLTSAGGNSYTYGPEGNRTGVSSSAGLTKWTIDPNSSLSRALIREKPDGAKTSYVYGLGLLYEVEEDNTTLSYHYDARGSTAALTADDGTTVTSRFEYDAYGRETWTSGSLDSPFRYHGAYGVQTDDNGLCFMRARYYSPQLRRFINADPSGFSGGSNFHLFASANPLAFADPLGLEPVRNKFGSVEGNMSDWHAGFDSRGMLGVVDAFGNWHTSFCMSCHDYNNPAAIQNFQAVMGGDAGWWIYGKDWVVAMSPAIEIGLAKGLASLEAVSLEAASLPVENAAKTVAVADGKFYSTAFETKLSPASYPGVSRYLHLKEANVALDAALQSNPALAELGISVPKSPTGSILGKSPENWVWHHDTNPGVMQLVPKSQHPNIPGGIFWETMHPGGNGGFSIWGK